MGRKECAVVEEVEKKETTDGEALLLLLFAHEG